MKCHEAALGKWRLIKDHDFFCFHLSTCCKDFWQNVNESSHISFFSLLSPLCNNRCHFLFVCFFFPRPISSVSDVIDYPKWTPVFIISSHYLKTSEVMKMNRSAIVVLALVNRTESKIISNARGLVVYELKRILDDLSLFIPCLSRCAWCVYVCMRACVRACVCVCV